MSYYMSIFAAVVAGSFFIALAARAFPLRRRLNMFREPIPNPIGFLIPAAAFGIFSGLRITLGDTDSYVYSYRLVDIDNLEPIPFRFAGGTLYTWLSYQCQLRSPDPYELIMITSLIAVVPTIYIIYKYSAPYELGVALFVLTGYYTFSMNGIRQYAAAGILLLGTKYLFSDKKTDFFKYLIFVLAAWLFHSSAIFMIIIYFVVRRRAWTPLTAVLLVSTIFVTLIFNAILPAFLDFLEDTGYSIYAENGWFTGGTQTGSNIFRVLILIAPLVLAFLDQQYFRDIYGRKWDILVNLSLMNFAFYILSLYNWIFARLAIYTSVYVIILMTYVITKGQNRERSRWLYPASLVMYIVYFVLISYSVLGYESELF